MARYRRGAKSQAVRGYLAEHPEASPQAVVAALKAETGMSVKVTLVNSIKYNKRRNPGRKHSPVARAAARRTSRSKVTLEQLVEVKRFADSLGGAAALRQALDMLELLR